MNLYEILVPTMKPEWMPGKNRFFKKRYHKLWDAKVLNIANGLTILQPSKIGHWQSLSGELFSERMIPVRVSCTPEQIDKIMAITAKHYQQLAVMAYKVSDEVILKHFDLQP